MDLPNDFKAALMAGDPIAELVFERLVDTAYEAFLDRQLEEDWDDAARARTYGHDDD